MKLEIAAFHVRDVRFGSKTELKHDTLFFDRQELRSHLLEDNRLSDIDIKIVHPGEKSRIINVLDVIDSRKKSNNGSEVFPGILGSPGLAGSGRTNVLRNVCIVETGSFPGFFGGIIDMSGKGSEYSPYAKTHNVVLVPKAKSDVDAIAYAEALKKASLKTSVYLGNVALNAMPDELETVEFALGEIKAPHKKLPRVGYIWHVLSHYELRSCYYYGMKLTNFYPVLITPGEIFDGAVVCGHYDHSPGLKNYSYSILNHPVIRGLYARDDKEIDFAGVILTNSPKTVDEKKRNAALNAQMAKHTLSLDGAIISKEGGGHTDLDLMETCKQCERLGIKTAIMDIEMLSSDGTGDHPFVVFEPDAGAAVSLGNFEARVRVSEMDAIIGGEGMRELGEVPGNEQQVPIWLLVGAISEIGMSRIKGVWF